MQDAPTSIFPLLGLSLPVFHSCRVKRSKILITEMKRCRGDILFKMSHFAGAWNRQHDRAALQHPGERNLGRTDAQSFGYLIHNIALVGKPTRS